MDSELLQSDLDTGTVSNWVKRWQMEFSVSKCKVIHYAKGNYPTSQHSEEHWMFLAESVCEWVCVFVGVFVNTITSKRVNVG